jgi:hypothetical protein
MKSSLTTMLAFALVMLLPLPVWAVDNAKAKMFKVHVNLQGDQEVGAKLAKVLQEEFAGLKDVELVKEKPAWKMDMIAAAARNDKNEIVEYVVCVLTTQHFSDDYWNGVYETVAESILHRQDEQKDKSGKLYPPGKKTLETLKPAWTTSSTRTVLDLATENMMRQHGYYLKANKDMRALAKDVVANFDKSQLEAQRKK